jgi:hypothetical protein
MATTKTTFTPTPGLVAPIPAGTVLGTIDVDPVANVGPVTIRAPHDASKLQITGAEPSYQVVAVVDLADGTFSTVGNFAGALPISVTIAPATVIPPPSTFDPRTMSVAQIAAATGIQVPVSSLKKSGAVTIKSPGTFENMDYSGTVTIETTGKVLFRNCRFDAGGAPYCVLNIPENFMAEEIRLEFCTLSNCKDCVAGANLYVYRCAMSLWENGVNFWGPGQLIESYIHDPDVNRAGAHYDGVEINGGGNINLLRNYIVNTQDQTSALMLGDETSPFHDAIIDGNYLAGGGYTIYLYGGPRVTFTNNTLKKGHWGYEGTQFGTQPKIDASTGNVLI